MNSKQLLIALTICFGPMVANTFAFPIKGLYLDDPTLCDSHPQTTFGHEIGDAAVFPPNEAILVQSTNTSNVICVADDGFPNDFLVRITNVSGNSWKDLFFVVDGGVSVGNVDGYIEDTTFPGLNLAFKIDNVGLNKNLIAGDTNNNLIFEPGEAWEFLLTNFVAPANLPPFPVLGSVGLFSDSSNIDGGSNASIVANLVPEPSAMAIALAISSGIVLRRRNRLFQ